MLGIDDTLAHGAGDEGAMVDPLAVIVPGILMGIEMDEGQRTVLGGMRLQQWPCNEMIATEREEESARGNDFRGFGLDQSRRLLVTAVVEQHIAVIHHRHLFEQIARKRILRIVVEDRRGAPDRLRPETGARPVRNRCIEGNAQHDGIGALHILAVAAAHEGQRARIGRIRRGATYSLGRKRVVDRFARHALPYLSNP